MTDSGRARPVVRGWLIGGAVVAAVTALALGGAGFGPGAAVVLGVLLALLPALSVAQARVLETEAIEVERTPAYLSSMVMLWVLAGLSWVVGGGAEGLGLAPLPAPALAGWTLGLTAAVVAVLIVFRALGPAFGARESGVLRVLLPRTKVERTVFVGVSLSAGVGEELAYRGLALLALVPILGAAGSAVLTSVVFGVLHAYQGVVGMARTALMGGILAWGLLASGSLWPGVLAHVAVDVIAGVILGERLMVPDETSGV